MHLPSAGCERMIGELDMAKTRNSTGNLPRTLPPEALDMIAGRFRALSEASRLKLIIALEAGEKNVTQLVAATGCAQTNVSRQLAVLAQAGIVARRREGVSMYYRVADPAIFALCDHVCGSLQRDFERQSKLATFPPPRS